MDGDDRCSCPNCERARLGNLLADLLSEHWPESHVNGWYLADLLMERGVGFE